MESIKRAFARRATTSLLSERDDNIEVITGRVFLDSIS
jgi:hypothetical protein